MPTKSTEKSEKQPENQQWGWKTANQQATIRTEQQ